MGLSTHEIGNEAKLSRESKADFVCVLEHVTETHQWKDAIQTISLNLKQLNHKAFLTIDQSSSTPWPPAPVSCARE